MMEKVKRGEINLICVKDFSRFSRDYIETGNYLECTFPFMGVRLISINDGYDSDDYKGTTGGLEVVMRSIIYAAYSKDLSVKTTSAKVQMMKQGKTAAIPQQNEQHKASKLRLYEKYAAGHITKEAYIQQKAATYAKIAENDEAIQRSHERMKELDSETSCSDEKLDAVCDQYKVEQKQLESEAITLQQEIEVQERQNENIEKCIQKAHKYVGIEKLDGYALRELVSAVYVDAPDKSSGKRVQHIHIKYDGLGFIPLNERMKKETA